MSNFNNRNQFKTKIMKSTTTYVPEITKEKLSGLHFPPEEVLPLGEQQLERKRLLKRALDFGNYAHYKIAILFEDSAGLKRVETTVWDMDEEVVYLKDGITIPLRRIVEVQL